MSMRRRTITVSRKARTIAGRAEEIRRIEKLREIAAPFGKGVIVRVVRSKP